MKPSRIPENRRARYALLHDRKFVAALDVGAIDDWLDDLRDDALQALRPAAQAGAQVLYEAVRSNVPIGTRGHWFHGRSFKLDGKKWWFDAGTLRDSIYQVYSKDWSTSRMATYHISWNHTEAPYAHMVEYGTVKTSPVAFLRRAMSQMPKALEVAEDEFYRRLTHFK